MKCCVSSPEWSFLKIPVAALRFEWGWQNPSESLLFRDAVAGILASEKNKKSQAQLACKMVIGLIWILPLATPRRS